MKSPPEDDRNPMAVAYQWAMRTMTISLEMVVPGLVGYWIDVKLGTQVVFLLAGFALGMTLALWHLIKISKQTSPGKSLPRPSDAKRNK